MGKSKYVVTITRQFGSMGRPIAKKMAEKLGQPVVVENKPGATGAIGATQVKRAAADGYTILCASIGVWVANPFLQKNLAYDPAKDFDLLSVAVKSPNVLVTHPSVPAKDVKELVAYLKQKPNKVTFPSSGAGSSDHLTAALFWMSTGTTGIHVPYKGGGPAIADLVAGHAEVSFQNLNNVIGHIKAGKLKALAVTSLDASTSLPGVPPLSATFKGFSIDTWWGLVAPAATPKPIIDKLNKAFVAALNAPETKTRFAALLAEPVATTPQQFDSFMASERAKYQQVVKASGAKVD